MSESISDIELNSKLTLLKDTVKYRANPAMIQRAILGHLRDVTEGKIDVVDPTSPFVFALECASITAAAAVIENEVNTRRLYPRLSQTPDEIYTHMSDIDFLDRFGTPAKTYFSIILDKNEVLDKMIPVGSTGIKKITIPRNSEFIIADTYTFSIQYPIDIKQMRHGGLEVTYDNSELSPLNELATNVVDWEFRTGADSKEYIYLKIEVDQFNCISKTDSMNTGASYATTIKLPDGFYFCRVFYKNNVTVTWREMLTTHSDQVYDINHPTALLKVVDDMLSVSVPQIYTNTGLVSGSIRIVTYCTKGRIQLDPSVYKPTESFAADWKNLDDKDDTAYCAAFRALRTNVVYTSDLINSGSDALSFSELRDRVIKNRVGQRNIPITPGQLRDALYDMGYILASNVDVITNRIFKATREMPRPIYSKLVTQAATSIEVFSSTLTELKSISDAEKLSNGLRTVYDNGERTTLTPNAWYESVNGIVKMVDQSRINALLALAPDLLSDDVNSNKYLKSPFHYVLDSTRNEFTIRPYYLDKPVARSVMFVEDNDLTQMQVTAAGFTLDKTPTGYLLTIVTKSDAAVKAAQTTGNLFAQLSYIPLGEQMRASLVGQVNVGADDDELIITFDLTSLHDIDRDDRMSFNSFHIFTGSPTSTTFTSLNTEMDLLFITDVPNPIGWAPIAADSIVESNGLPVDVKVITHEKIRLEFGKPLSDLWSRCRSTVRPQSYQRYTSDQYWVYDKDVYQIDPVTGSSVIINPDNTVSFVKLHSAGDLMKDVNNDPIVRFAIGDIVKNPDGSPVPISSGDVLRHMELMFIEGCYFFSSDWAAKGYREHIVASIVEWVTKDLKTLEDKLLEQTRVYFYPKATMGKIKALTDSNDVRELEALQTFYLKVYVSAKTYQDQPLREKLVRLTVETIDSLLKTSVICTSDIISAIRDALGGDILNVTMDGMGRASDLQTITLTDDANRLAIKKVLKPLPDGNTIVVEDVTVEFIKHEF